MFIGYINYVFSVSVIESILAFIPLIVHLEKNLYVIVSLTHSQCLGEKPPTGGCEIRLLETLDLLINSIF